MENLEHTPYSPDISPCDFFLFGYVKARLKSYTLNSVYELVKVIEEIIQKLTKMFRKRFIFHGSKDLMQSLSVDETALLYIKILNKSP